jgi:hypothetical protein
VPARVGKLRFGEPVDIVTLNDADRLDSRQIQRLAEIVQEVAGFGGVDGLFLDENAIHERADR